MLRFNRSAASTTAKGAQLSGGGLLTAMPLLAFFYVLLLLPFLPDDGQGRELNILFWPAVAALVLMLSLQNKSLMDGRYTRSLPIISLVVYLVFAGASVVWALQPGYAFSRWLAQIFLIVIVLLPYSLPIDTKNTIRNLHFFYAIAFAISAVYVWTIPPTPVGHAGFLPHKQGLGLLAAVGVILACHELLVRGARRFFGLAVLCVGVWLVLESQSKSALAFAFISMLFAALLLMFGKWTKLSPAYAVAAVVFASLFFTTPIERLGARFYGDPTLTGRTAIWGFVEYQMSRKPWLGWGFHSYYFVPNSPQLEATGFVREMPSSHSGFLEVKLETGRIGYWLFLIFTYVSLHCIEAVRRIDPLRAWCFLSIQMFAILINLLDSAWFTLSHLWVLYLIVVAESIRYSWSTVNARVEHAAGTEPIDAGRQLRPYRPLGVLGTRAIRSAGSQKS